MLSVRVQPGAFDVGHEIAAATAGRADLGAVVSFVGLTRDATNGQDVQILELEHYPGMTEKTLAALARQAQDRFAVDPVAIIHRVGRLAPTEPIVLVVTGGTHRDACFDACRFLIDRLKTEAPFWKKEHRASGAEWVDARAADDAAAARWQADHGAPVAG